jgi:hypothetical protein
MISAAAFDMSILKKQGAYRFPAIGAAKLVAPYSVQIHCCYLNLILSGDDTGISKTLLLPKCYQPGCLLTVCPGILLFGLSAVAYGAG